jgi:hypothetical protein
MHSTLNYVSPAQYKQQWSQARPGRGTDPGNRLRRFPHFHRHHDDGNMIPLTRSLRDTHSEGKISMCFLLWGEPGRGGRRRWCALAKQTGSIRRASLNSELAQAGAPFDARFLFAQRLLRAGCGVPDRLLGQNGPGRMEGDYLRTKRRTFPVDFWMAEVSASCCGVNLAEVPDVFVFLGFWGFWVFGFLGFWGFGVLGFWVFGSFGVLGFWFWGFGVLG